MADDTLEELKAKRDKLIELKTKRDQLMSMRGNDDYPTFDEGRSELGKYASTPERLVRKGIAATLSGLQATGNIGADAINKLMHITGSPAAGVFEDTGERADFYKMMGVKPSSWYTPAGLAETALEYLGPSEIGAAASGVAGLSRAAPKAMKYAEPVGRALDRAVAGALTNMLGNEDATASNTGLTAAISSVLPPLLTKAVQGGMSAKAAIQNLPNSIRNLILSQTEKSAEKGAAHTPEQAAENIAQNFTNVKGERMPVDFGTATNMSPLETAYDYATMVPFTGGTEAKNIIKNQTADLAIKRAEDALTDAEKYAADIRGLSTEEIAKHRANIGQLESEYKVANENHQKINYLTEKAPDVVNNMVKDISDKGSLPEYLSNESRRAYKDLRSDAARYYKKLDELNLELPSSIPGESKFRRYNEVNQSMQDQLNSITETFGTDKDLPSAIKSEIQAASALIENESGSPIKIKDIRLHLSNLGKLWERAKDSGDDNLARMVINMRRALSADTKELLKYTGNQEALDLWTNADDKWSQSAKFWNSKEMRQVVGKKTTNADYISKGGKLAKELHDPNNQEVMGMLSPQARKAAGHLLITGDKVKKLTPDKISKIVGGLTKDELAALAAHSPEEASYLSDLSENLERSKKMGAAKENLAKTIERVKSPPGSELQSAVGNIAKRKEDVEKAKAERLKSNRTRSGTGSAIAKIATGSTLAGTALFPSIGAPLLALGGTGIAGSRILQKLLTNPELLDRYISGEKFPVKKAGKAPDLARMIDEYISRNR